MQTYVFLLSSKPAVDELNLAQLRDQQTFSMKGHTVNSLSFVGVLQLFNSSVAAWKQP